jgi:hypothetical protein
MAARVVALVEHPSEEPDEGYERPTRQAKVNEDQQSLM